MERFLHGKIFHGKKLHEKIFPGEKFPWQELANKKIGIWHSFNSKELIKYRRLKISNKEKFKNS